MGDGQKPWQEWRERLERQHKDGCLLERVAEDLDLPFEVRPTWPALDWVVWGDTLHGFMGRVRQVAAKLGPPDKMTKDGDEYSVLLDRPDLEAQWDVASPHHPEGHKVRIHVRALAPKDCKIDPRVSPAEAVRPKLHPECKAALEELAEELRDG